MSERTVAELSCLFDGTALARCRGFGKIVVLGCPRVPHAQPPLDWLKPTQAKRPPRTRSTMSRTQISSTMSAGLGPGNSDKKLIIGRRILPLEKRCRAKSNNANRPARRYLDARRRKHRGTRQHLLPKQYRIGSPTRRTFLILASRVQPSLRTRISSSSSHVSPAPEQRKLASQVAP
jgi:hypothetical protein